MQMRVGLGREKKKKRGADWMTTEDHGTNCIRWVQLLFARDCVWRTGQRLCTRWPEWLRGEKTLGALATAPTTKISSADRYPLESVAKRTGTRRDGVARMRPVRRAPCRGQKDIPSLRFCRRHRPAGIGLPDEGRLQVIIRRAHVVLQQAPATGRASARGNGQSTLKGLRRGKNRIWKQQPKHSADTYT